MSTFEQFKLCQQLIQVLEEQGYDQPTPIQSAAIPGIMEGRDLLGLAQTGTGKTAAFALPILNRYAQEEQDPSVYNRVRAIIMAPTRELALQIGEAFKTYGRETGLQTGVIFGGVTPKRHLKVLKREPSILVATPGRLRSFLEDDLIDVSALDYLVLDEADRMLEFGMLEDVQAILKLLPVKRQNLLFSATMPSGVKGLVQSILKNPLKVQVEAKQENMPKIKQEVLYLEETHKADALIDLLLRETVDSILVFVRTKAKADKLAKQINGHHIRTKALHGDIDQSRRMEALSLFKQGQVKVMIATDVAARGIDVQQLGLVINFNIPNVPETYVHRIGRTGRAGEEGHAISFCSQAEREFLQRIQELTGQKIKEIKP